MAVGNNSVASHDNAVALGNGSVTSSADSVSVGAVGAERAVQNVAPGVLGTDATNVNQLNAVQKSASRGVAIGMASVQEIPRLAPGEFGMGVGFGHYNGETAIGATMAYSINARAMVSMGVAHSGGKSGVRAGASFKF